MVEAQTAPRPNWRTRRFLAWGRKVLERNERGLFKRKKKLFIDAGVGGRVLDFGSGFGLTLHYLALPEIRPAVESVVCLEPNALWEPQLRDFHAETAPDLPMEVFTGYLDTYLEGPDAGVFDCVVCSQVLCSVGDEQAIRTQLALIRRALKPGGVFVFSEHVAADPFFRAAAQRVVGPLWSCLGDGCSLRRRTGRIIESLAWEKLSLERWWYKQAGPAWPQIVGYAITPR